MTPLGVLWPTVKKKNIISYHFKGEEYDGTISFKSFVLVHVKNVVELMDESVNKFCL